MAQVVIRGGMPVEIPTAEEIGGVMDERLAAAYRVQAEIESARHREHARSVKWMRLPAILSGKVTSSAVTLGVASGRAAVGPDLGYAWVIKRLVVSGLAAGATPDVVNLYLNDSFSYAPVWQFNGNNFGYTFGDGELVLLGGDTLSLKNSGTITATGTVSLAGELIEMASERLGEFLS